MPFYPSSHADYAVLPFLKGQLPEQFNVVQISDLHLHQVPTSEDDASVQGLLQIFHYLAMHQLTIDLIVVTGDLVHDTTTPNYDYIFDQLNQLNIPYICQAGNHDVTQELDSNLPFAQRRHVAVLPDSRLFANYAIDTLAWRLLFLDSTLPGKVAGYYSEDTLAWLTKQLSISEKMCVIFTHHPSWSVHSRWIDQHQLQNHEQFWQTVQPYVSKLKAIFSGHVHQESHYQQTVGTHSVQLYTVPSTSIQFLPFADEFALDPQSLIGLRQITLYNNATLVTGVKRIHTR